MRLPGREDLLTVTMRQFLLDGFPVTVEGGVMDSTNSYDGSNTNFEWRIRPGWCLGYITASKKLCPLKRTRANGAGSAVVTLIVDNAAAFKAGDTLAIGATTGTIQSVNYGTNTITLTATKTWNDRDPVTGNSSLAGSGDICGILAEETFLKDEFGNMADENITYLSQAHVIQSQLLGDIASVLAITLTDPLVNRVLSKFMFNTDIGRA